jgi:hypothetical protein
MVMAKFVDGPLRRRIDITGRLPAEKRNINNDCGCREVVSLHAFQLKRWIIWRMNDEGKGKSIQEVSLKDYSVSKEGDRSKAYKGEKIRAESIDELIIAIGEEDAQEKISDDTEKRDEDLLLDGGSDDNDGKGAAD